MPAKIKKLPSGKYMVMTPNEVHAKSTTKEKAEAQARLLNAIEHGWKPSNTVKSAPKRAVKRVRHSPLTTEVDCSKLRQDVSITTPPETPDKYKKPFEGKKI